MDLLNVGTPPVSGGSPSVLSSTMGSSSALSGQAARKAAAQKQRSRLAHRVTMAVPVDISGFASQNFQPSVYLQYNMDNDKPEVIEATMQSLELVQQKSIADIQRTIYRNYPEFIQVSKELSAFEGNLGEMRSIMAQLQTISEALMPDCGVTTEGAVDAAKDEDDGAIPGMTAGPSIAVDLGERKAKNNRIMDTVAGLEEFLGGDDRYLVFEGAENTTSLPGGKAPRPINLYLFNDSIIAAYKKTGSTHTSSRMSKTFADASAAKPKLALEFMLMFTGLAFEGAAETNNDLTLTHADAPKGPIVIQFDSPSTKKLWVDQLKKAVITFKMEEAVKRSTLLNVNPLKERQVKKAFKATLHRRGASMTSASVVQKKSAAEKSHSQTTDLPVERYNKIMYALDDLHETTATRKYDDAVQLVDQIKSNLDHLDATYIGSPRLHKLREELEDNKGVLAEYLLREISKILISKKETIHFIQILSHLGYTDQAREQFLSARSDFIRKKAKNLDYAGDIKSSIRDLSALTFAGIRTTAEWYRAAFDDVIKTAGLIFWIKLEIGHFAEVASKLIFRSNSSFEDISQTLLTSRQHCQSLREIGLDFVSVLDDCFGQPVSVLMGQETEELLPGIKESIETDSFTEFVQVANYSISTSIHEFQETLLTFINRFDPILHDDAGRHQVAKVALLFEAAADSLMNIFYSDGKTDNQNQAVISALEFLSNHLLPSVAHQISTRFQQSFPVLRKLENRLKASVHAMYEILAENCTESWLPSGFGIYAKDGSLEDDANISQWLLQVLPIMTKMSQSAPVERRMLILQHLHQNILMRLTKLIDSGAIQFRLGGLEQFLLDVQFMMKAFEAFTTTEIVDHGLQVCSKALNAYKGSVALSGKPTMKSAQWYDDRIALIMVTVSKYMLDFGLPKQ